MAHRIENMANETKKNTRNETTVMKRRNNAIPMKYIGIKSCILVWILLHMLSFWLKYGRISFYITQQCVALTMVVFAICWIKKFHTLNRKKCGLIELPPPPPINTIFKHNKVLFKRMNRIKIFTIKKNGQIDKMHSQDEMEIRSNGLWL